MSPRSVVCLPPARFYMFGSSDRDLLSEACSKRRATAVPNLNQFDAAVARQWSQTSNLIQSRQILKYRNE